jgi:DNA-binding MarR family transcriptional regulator
MVEELVLEEKTGHPVTYEESRRMFGLLLNLVLADIAVARVDHPPGTGPLLAPTLMRALIYMMQQMPRTLAVGDLADGLNISFGWASRIADELAGLGLIERDRDEGDRRVVHLRLTAKAKQIGKRILRKREAPITAALATIEPADRAVLTDFLRRLTQEFDRHAAESAAAARE